MQYESHFSKVTVQPEGSQQTEPIAGHEYWIGIRKTNKDALKDLIWEYSGLPVLLFQPITLGRLALKEDCFRLDLRSGQTKIADADCDDKMYSLCTMLCNEPWRVLQHAWLGKVDNFEYR